ncbi:MAG: glycosyltransferase family 2 protein [Nitrospirota bacterium]|nr:MAG: glycosyltransferase family 2 protein [Nitrospirota bacterium]
MSRRISVIVPNRNGADTIGICLEALCGSLYDDYEVIVVDDASEDASRMIIKRYPCTLIELDEHSGAAAARNVGAGHASGEILFFTDADCIVSVNTLEKVALAYDRNGENRILGGSYTSLPYDKDFYSTFQSVFINHNELRDIGSPDYVATHAMIINADKFRALGGFNETFLPMIEDVEFSHRAKRGGMELSMIDGLVVRHKFNFNFLRSVRNAFMKSMYWTAYILKSKNIFDDSGTASLGLKANVILTWSLYFILITGIVTSTSLYPVIAAAFVLNVLVNIRLINAMYRARGIIFTLKSVVYYFFVYPIPVGAGAIFGNFMHFNKSIQFG